jgi:hypothetical protein
LIHFGNIYLASEPFNIQAAERAVLAAARADIEDSFIETSFPSMVLAHAKRMALTHIQKSGGCPPSGLSLRNRRMPKGHAVQGARQLRRVQTDLL